MGRKYKINSSDYIPKNIYGKARENMRKKKKEALKIIRKSKLVDSEMKILCITVTIIVIMFAASPFVIMWNNKKNIKNTKNTNNVKNDILDIHTENDIKTQTNDINNTGIHKLINDAGNILSDINHPEIFH